MTGRVHNFNPGPAALPLPVLEQVQSNLLDFAGTGMSILEMSHRSATYEELHNQAIADLRTLLGGTEDHAVLFMGGGAQMQFALVALNLLCPRVLCRVSGHRCVERNGAERSPQDRGCARALVECKHSAYPDTHAG